MHRTAALLVASLACFVAGGILTSVVDWGTALVLPGFVLLMAAVASSYLSDLLEGYRAASAE